MKFTPNQLHYFKRELITEEIKKELQLLINIPDITSITEKQCDKDNNEFPFIRYIFHHLIIEFPLLKNTCDDNFWPKCKLFFDEYNKSQLDQFYAPHQSESNIQRRIVRHKIEKSFVFAFCASIKTMQGQESSIRIHSNELPPTTTMAEKKLFRINIIGVRQTKIKRAAFIDTLHAEFLVESNSVVVARRHGDFKRLREQIKRHFKNLDLPLVPSKSSNHAYEQGYRENDRLLLRCWLNDLIQKNPHVQKSHMLTEFLTENPIVLSEAEAKDAQQRKTWDDHRAEDQQRYQKEVERRVNELNNTLDGLKKQVIEPGGLVSVFNSIKTTKRIQDLPVSLRKAFEWGRINFAFVLHNHFISSDTAMDNVDKLRKTHALVPYKTLSVILRFSNPISMVKSILDLFLAQPFGGKSLLQRMIISNLSDENKEFQKEIDVLKDKINHQALCDKLFRAVRAPVPEDSEYKACKSKSLELFSIMANNAIEPVVSEEHISDIVNNRKQTKHLLKLWELYAKQYEHELLMDFFFQGLTGELIKEFISVFYQPLAQVYKAADISTTIRHAADFVDDLLELIDKIQKQNEQEKESRSIQLFIDLVQRHEHYFYDFVHNVHSQEASNIFDELIQYLDRLFTFVAEGIPGKIDLVHCIQEAGIESNQDLAELEQEINALCDYRYQQKIYRFERQKRKMGTMGGITRNDKDEIFQFITERSEIANALEEFDEEDSSSSSSDETQSESSHSDLSSVKVDSRNSQMSGASQLSYDGIEPPQLRFIPKVLPFFIKDISKMIE